MIEITAFTQGFAVGDIITFTPPPRFWRRCLNWFRRKLGYKVEPYFYRVTSVSSNRMTASADGEK